MERHDFYGSVQHEASLASQTDAEVATQAVLSALGERLDETRSQRLDGMLPREIGDHLTDGASDRRFDYAEFCSRIDERSEHADIDDPEPVARAVVGTLLEHVDDDESEALRERLAELEFEDAIPESGPGAKRSN
ncbi:DUF2267 domain-containing protein [Natronorubrum daqingense]|uniref:Uncharacterized conserved protein, DUF2267 family n=1 Tax=Natronorubrum daqingense TaxID=588898 RepID=A0A1N7F2U1_9EURY|nr:DUF2267 domain-containing protein [Natronorubrum daqingense]APX97498.1 hypothetical protein BB347_13270 [Natronorubrum daqingense]SIR94683.1 Uncharacterized conserved protein, DUF2267 family [Natronorubrum daqingense]